MEREFQSLESYNEKTNSFEASQYSGRQRDGNIRDNGRVEEWIEQFKVDTEKNGLGISVEPITLLFEDLSFMRYDEDMKEGTSIFSNIMGYARPRNMLALMGGSKGSKSTLLKCLAGRAPSMGSLEGSLQAKCWDKVPAYSRLISYVEKLDAHQPYLSVRETLHFSAALRLSQTISSVNRHIHVELVLDQLDLLPYSNQLVGSLRDATGKTFEIAKKITIAVELAANPSILFLEEPLSGLDSRGTASILNVLSQVSNSGRVIIATLAHPNARTLDFFDLALILTHEGQQVYFGPIGPDCSDLLGYFLSVTKVPYDSMRASPVGFVMATLGVGIKKRATPPINFAGAYPS
ncbi:pleiotropic drug resistance protein 1-like [Eucalyptus grandis]|uniref:pleiotropic drug resistance protein 1-like n=1 Tax=Eucalyptus grandis TaxID=71139 RepID=UPI00192F06D3|nr:pleiotropic drug resistance protein 1-like [Eucalyptus grandis]